jgi:glycosyltransferase involved in cell wall biosynthesis
MRSLLIIVAGKDPLEERGGHSSYVRAHARAAIRAGFEPHLFCTSHRSGRVETDYGVVHSAASPFPVRAAMTPFHSHLILQQLRRFLRRWRGRLLAHSFGLAWGNIGARLARQMKGHGLEIVPVVSAFTTYEHELLGKIRGLNPAHNSWERATRRAEYFWIPVMSACERVAYTRSRLVLVNYESVKSDILLRHGPGAPIAKVPYTAETAFIDSETGRTGDDSPALPLIVSVSRHDPRKGIDVLLRAMALMHAAGLRFRAALVGGGVLIDSHRALAAKLRLPPSISIEGVVPEPRFYLCQADVFVLPSIQEGSGSVSLLEALQHGVPVVASNLDGIPEEQSDPSSFRYPASAAPGAPQPRDIHPEILPRRSRRGPGRSICTARLRGLG